MNIIWYLSDQHACGIVRADVPARAINKAGKATAFCKINLSLSDFFGSEVMVFQRSCTEDYLNRLLTAKDRGLATIYDIDDDLFNVPAHVPDAYEYFSRGGTKELIGRFLRAADLVTVSTKYMADYIRQYTDRPIVVVENCIDNGHVQFAIKSPDRPKKNPDRVTIGWHGSMTHVDDAELVAEAIEWALTTFLNVDVSFYGSFEAKHFNDRFAPFGPRVTFQGWANSMDIYTVLSTFDIGLAPLKPTPFNLCKSGIKWMEYAAVEVPCIASDVVPYQFLEHGQDVLLTNMLTESWKAHMGWLVEDANRRKLMGRAARIRLLNDFDNRVIGPMWIDAFHLAITEAHSTKTKKSLR